MGNGRWYAWFLSRWEALRESYWLFPAQMAVLSAIAAFAMIELDRRVVARWEEPLSWLTQVGADGARSVLSTIAGSMITVTGVVFSITIVALTLTSSQFGPRLLRTFFRDRGSQLALGTFLATFCYSLLVLRAVESGGVPQLATAGAVLLAVASLFVLIFFVHHAASSIQASSVIAAVAREMGEQIPSLFPESIGEERGGEPGAGDRERIQRLERQGDAVCAEGEGYVRVLDDEGILSLARERDLLVSLAARPGDFVSPGAPLARVLGGGDDREETADRVRGCFILGDHRTPVQDLRFLTEQLTEMAVRALSPGINDPKTAIECLHRLGSVIAQVSDRAMPSGLRYDAEGVLRVIVVPTRFASIVASCLDSIRHHGSQDPQVAIALLEAVATGARACRERERLALLAEHAREIHGAFVEGQRGGSKRDRTRVDTVFEAVRSEIEARIA